MVHTTRVVHLIILGEVFKAIAKLFKTSKFKLNLNAKELLNFI